MNLQQSHALNIGPSQVKTQTPHNPVTRKSANWSSLRIAVMALRCVMSQLRKSRTLGNSGAASAYSKKVTLLPCVVDCHWIGLGILRFDISMNGSFYGHIWRPRVCGEGLLPALPT